MLLDDIYILPLLTLVNEGDVYDYTMEQLLICFTEISELRQDQDDHMLSYGQDAFKNLLSKILLSYVLTVELLLVE